MPNIAAITDEFVSALAAKLLATQANNQLKAAERAPLVAQTLRLSAAQERAEHHLEAAQYAAAIARAEREISSHAWTSHYPVKRNL
jgi:hypothetical protein